MIYNTRHSHDALADFFINGDGLPLDYTMTRMNRLCFRYNPNQGESISLAMDSLERKNDNEASYCTKTPQHTTSSKNCRRQGLCHCHGLVDWNLLLYLLSKSEGRTYSSPKRSMTASRGFKGRDEWGYERKLAGGDGRHATQISRLRLQCLNSKNVMKNSYPIPTSSALWLLACLSRTRPFDHHERFSNHCTYCF
jgi:hypothetical protein